MRKLLISLMLFSSALWLGCAMCQDCEDDLGPVPQSENFPSFQHSPRVNSATTTPPGSYGTPMPVEAAPPDDGAFELP